MSYLTLGFALAVALPGDTLDGQSPIAPTDTITIDKPTLLGLILLAPAAGGSDGSH